jgi:hypothetical protein
VNWPTMATQRRGLAKVLVQRPKAAFDVIATASRLLAAEASRNRWLAPTRSSAPSDGNGLGAVQPSALTTVAERRLPCRT